jgi:hypothetical protein
MRISVDIWTNNRNFVFNLSTTKEQLRRMLLNFKSHYQSKEQYVLLLLSQRIYQSLLISKLQGHSLIV